MNHLIPSICCIAASLAIGQTSLAANPEDTTRKDVLIFSSSRSGQGDLYIAGENTIHEKLVFSQLPEGTARVDAFRNRIVFHRFIDDQAYLYSGDEKIMRDPNGDAPPVWSPTGQSIAYVHPSTQKLMLANTDGNETRQVTFGEAIDRYPCWSPDGKKLVFCRKTEEGWDLYSVDVSKSITEEQDIVRGSTEVNVERLTNRKVYCGHPAWSADGRHIAFDTSYSGDVEIAVLDLKVGKVERLTSRLGNDLVPAWSLDGGRIAFAGEPKGSNNWDVWEIDLAKPEQIKRVTKATSYDGAPLYVDREWVKK